MQEYRPYGDDARQRWAQGGVADAPEGVNADEGSSLPRPTDADIVRMQYWAKLVLDEFIPILGLQHYSITIDWHRTRLAAPNEGCAMMAHTRDQYLDGMIEIVAEQCYGFDMAGFRATLVHELCHFLTGEITGHIPDSDIFKSDMCERTTSQMAGAVLRAYAFTVDKKSWIEEFTSHPVVNGVMQHLAES